MFDDARLEEWGVFFIVTTEGTACKKDGRQKPTDESKDDTSSARKHSQTVLPDDEQTHAHE